MSSNNVIVFGPTGAVGGAAAQEAAERGAHVWLAMRDTSKSLNWLTPDVEKSGSYTRVQADLTDPASVTNAVKESGATSAFIYVVHTAGDMKPAVQALKDAGVTWVVLLSSFTIRSDVRTVKPQDMIPYFHAQVEISLQDVGIPFVAVRPGYFASNLFNFWWPGVQRGSVDIFQPDFLQDHIVPTNIGQVSGALLLQPKPDLKPTEPEIVYLLGPELIKQRDGAQRVIDVSNKDVTLKIVGVEEFAEGFNKVGFPPPIRDYMIRAFTGETDGNTYPTELVEQSRDNIAKISGKQPITFDQYLESIKSRLSA